MTTIIEVSDLVKRYEEQVAVKGVSFTVGGRQRLDGGAKG